VIDDTGLAAVSALLDDPHAVTSTIPKLAAIVATEASLRSDISITLEGAGIDR
jgi:hypothetical protein